MAMATTSPAISRPVPTVRTSPDPGRLAVEPWVIGLRAQFTDAGYDAGRVDELIASSVARFGPSRFGQFLPLLVERSVQRALRGRP